MPGGEARDVDGAGLARAELDAAEGDRSDPAQAAHPLEIDPAYAEPGRGLLRPERRLTVQQLGQALPGGDLVDLVGVEGAVPAVAAEVDQEVERDQALHRVGGHRRRLAGLVRLTQRCRDPARRLVRRDRLARHRSPHGGRVHRVHRRPRPCEAADVRIRDNAHVPRPAQHHDRRVQPLRGLGLVVLGSLSHGDSSLSHVRCEPWRQNMTDQSKTYQCPLKAGELSRHD
ncbi:hypothetical protein [Streptomyces venezuelae]|uniref:hypothetical protein n=1 Tax=Streptomyces venezuelae TaxID=54571 RepID=UPI0027E482B2|nr:hypothetical protein [Streptomyces venezuelae]